ncbi:Gfo/Idh/MocA family oxidoreductase [Metabacillus rhizolycopersici]|uniref:Gfo/Idh/MocA family oxidoreductase n=1 Tax=Metabacillus rhizolycopersici TaxID=2875709 RepID=A0ABS7UUI8_9BACI|nr:Gfo/Idh/MocA family oxidoreductase [Metabacillus rhizolycopersici]MBZ5751972.1 Gfo/Idh/MocA family oxidoreductase [Metabacillus rhizolycopersici]
MNIIKIAIIGVGQIGKRHFQALKLIDHPVKIFLVDSNKDSILQVKTEYQKINEPSQIQSVDYYQNLSSLPYEIDVVIVATPANVRKKIIEDIVNNNKIRYLILEKVVFQNPNHFSEINVLLKENNVKAWVNCPLRMVPFFQMLKKKINDSSNIVSPIDYRVNGSQLNLGSNAIHHLDLVSYLTNDTSFSLDSSLLDQYPTNSKRHGFLEFTGTLQGKSKLGSTITITSYPEKNVPHLIQINNIHMRCILKLNERKAWISEDSLGWEWKEIEFNIPYQSQLTHIAVQQIVDGGSCDLPNFSQSWALHVPLLQTLTAHLEKHGSGRVEFCPIT